MPKEPNENSRALWKPGSESLENHSVGKFYSSNNPLACSSLTTHSQYSVLWRCPNGESHEFQRIVAKMTSGSINCPYCSAKRLLPGFNDLRTRYGELIRQWSPDNELQPHEVLFNSSKKALWLCERGHRWETRIKQRTLQKHGCPYCAGLKAWPGFNDFASRQVEAMRFWHPNNTLSADEITEKSNKKVLWLCEEGHESLMSPRSWLYSGCKICSGRKLQKGYNDLFSRAPHLEDQWDYERNTENPRTLRYNERNYRAHWLCPQCSHRWRAVVRSRVAGSGCPRCAVLTSQLENIVYDYLRKHYRGELLLRARVLKRAGKNPLELDFYLPQEGLGFEVQDFTTHSRTSDEEHMSYRNHRGEEKFKKGPSYHRMKRELALESLSVTVVELWQDDIVTGVYREQVKEALKDCKRFTPS